MSRDLVKGVVLGAIVSTVTLMAASALAGTGIGAVFNLGQTNTVNAQSTLKGATSGKNLQITNTGTGGALGITVGSGKPPITVNTGAGKATNLNADKLDGSDSTAFVRTSFEAYAVVNHGGSFVSPWLKNFTAVSNPSAGEYCLTPATGIDPATRVAMVTPEWGFSAGGGLEAYIYAEANDCSPGQFEVITEESGATSNDVSFEIFVLKG